MSKTLGSYFVENEACDEQLEDTGFTKGFIVQKLLKGYNEFAERLSAGDKIAQISLEDISGHKGFTARVLKCTFGFQDSSISVVLKIFSTGRMEEMFEKFAPLNLEDGQMENGEHEPPPDEGTLKKMMEAGQKVAQSFHNSECTLYEFLKEIWARKGEPPLPLAKIFYTQKLDLSKAEQPGLIIMEDLSDRAHIETTIVEGLSTKQIENIVGHLASFHKNLLCIEGDSWKELFAETIIDEEGMEGMGKRFEHLFKSMDAEGLKNPLRRLKRVLGASNYMNASNKKYKEELGMPQLIIHGDLWVNNLLWWNDRCDEVAAFLDWQLSHKGNLASDIARMIALCTEPDIRHQLEGYIIDHYFKKLDSLMRAEGKQTPFRLEQLEKAYRMSFPGHAVGCAFVIPFFDRVFPEAIAGGDPDKTIEVRNSAEHRANIARLFHRSKVALDDAISMLEKDAPEWLDN